MATKKKTADPSTDLLVGFCLDRSPSMAHLTASTVEGFNRFLDEQRSQPGKTFLSLVLFDAGFEVRYTAQDLNEIPPLSAIEGPNLYRTNGSGTALYDAFGITMEGIEAWHANNPNFQGKTLAVALTDGEENSSRQWSLERLNAKIADRQGAGWAFSFLGAGQSAWLEGAKLVIPQHQVVNFVANAYANAGTYGTLSASTSAYRTTGSFSTT